MYEERTYRNKVRKDDLVTFEVVVKETDLQIKAERMLKVEAYYLVHKYRAQLESYIAEDPTFQFTFTPHQVKSNAPKIVREMAEKAAIVGVGPMAAVAGAIAEYVGRDLLNYSREIIVENGGDIFIKCIKPRRARIYAGSSPFSNRLALEVNPKDTPLGVCTSAGTVGHSVSLGKADAVVVVSNSTLLADAAATAIGNLIQSTEDIPLGIGRAQSIKGIWGVVIIKDEKLGAWGNLKLVEA